MNYYGNVLPADIALTVDADILVPAAREDTVTDVIAASTNVKLVVEGANLRYPKRSMSLSERWPDDLTAWP